MHPAAPCIRCRRAWCDCCQQPRCASACLLDRDGPTTTPACHLCKLASRLGSGGGEMAIIALAQASRGGPSRQEVSPLAPPRLAPPRFPPPLPSALSTRFVGWLAGWAARRGPLPCWLHCCCAASLSVRLAGPTGARARAPSPAGHAGSSFTHTKALMRRRSMMGRPAVEWGGWIWALTRIPVWPEAEGQEDGRAQGLPATLDWPIQKHSTYSAQHTHSSTTLVLL